MVNYSITFQGSIQMEISRGINAEVLPLMAQAVRAVAAQTSVNWKERVMRARLWSGEKDAYAATIKWEMTGDFSAVISSDYKYAADIETGRPPRDLKKMLDTSNKVRRTKDGRRFLIIPMRQNTQGNVAQAKAMPTVVHQLAQAMTPSRIVSEGRRPSGQVTHLSPTTGMSPSRKQTPFLSNISTKKAMTVTSRNYAWGDRLSRADLAAAGASVAVQKRYAGMVRMNTSTPGGKQSSAFLTFRVMVENGKGWVIPAQPGQYLARDTAADMQPKAERAFALAISKTLQST